MMPVIAVVLYTFDRLASAQRTLDALAANLRTREHALWWHIADDGSSQDYRDALWRQAGELGGECRSITNSERRGYGGSHNEAMRFVRTILGLAAILHMEDDWNLERTLDLDPLVAVLHEEPRIGCIRLGRLGYYHPLHAEFVWAGQQHFALLDPESPSQYVFSGGPRLERPDWTARVGEWPEHRPAGETELDICGRTAARTGVAWPLDLVKPRGDLFSTGAAASVKDAPLR